MSKTEEKVILITDDVAAEYRTDISGWVSRDGIFFGKDERTARWAGCTHVLCGDCGKPTIKGHIYCSDCNYKRIVEKYKALPQSTWDGNR
jgi:hypothetical protein